MGPITWEPLRSREAGLSPTYPAELRKMAYLQQLREESYTDKFFAIREDVNKFQNEEIAAAIKIQSWFRSRKTRSIINALHSCAVNVQRQYR